MFKINVLESISALRGSADGAIDGHLELTVDVSEKIALIIIVSIDEENLPGTT